MAFDPNTRADTAQEFLLWFLRSVGVVFLIFGIFAWAPIIGLTQETAKHLINLARPDQVVSVIFAVLLPTAGVGLWMGASWGVGLIVLSLLTHVILPIGFPQHYTADWLLIVGHAAIVLVYIALRFVIHKLH